MESSSSAPRPRILLAMLLGALLIRIVFILAHQTLPVSDEFEYDKLARTLVNSGTYAVDGVSTAYRPPGYPAFLALSYFLFGQDTLIPKVIQAILDTLTAYLLFCIGRIRSERVGLIAACTWSLFVPAILYVNLLLTESLTAFILVASVFIFLENTENRIPRLVGFGVLMGISALFKPALFLVPLLLLLLSTRMSIQPRHGILIVAGAFLVLLPWMIRNQITLGTFSLSTNTGMNLYIGNNPEATGAYRGVFPDILADPSFTEVARDREAMSLAKEYIISSPGTFLLNGAKKLVHLFRSEGDVLIAAFSEYPSPVGMGFKQRYRSVPIPLTILTNILVFAILFAGFLGWSFSIRNRQFWFTFSLLFALLAAHFVFFGGSRFHFIIMPFAVLYFSEVVVSFLKKELKLTGRQKVLLMTAFLVLSAIWSYELFVVFSAN